MRFPHIAFILNLCAFRTSCGFVQLAIFIDVRKVAGNPDAVHAEKLGHLGLGEPYGLFLRVNADIQEATGLSPNKGTTAAKPKKKAAWPVIWLGGFGKMEIGVFFGLPGK